MLSTSTLDSASGLNAQSPLHIRISSRGESKATAGEVQEENDVEDGDGLDDGMCIFIFRFLFCFTVGMCQTISFGFCALELVLVINTLAFTARYLFFLHHC